MSMPLEKPRVLHLITKGVIAGAEQLLIDLARSHDSESWDVRYATLFAPGEMNRRISESGQTCYALDFRGAKDLPAAAMRLARLVREERIDLLHTHLVHAGIVGLLVRSLVGRELRLVHTRHHSDALYKFGSPFGMPIKAKIDGFVARRQNMVCAVSRAARDVLVERERVFPERVRVTYPGIDIEGFRARVGDISGERIRGELGIGKEQTLLGVVAHLIPKKGHRFLIEALPAIIARHPCVVVFAGEGCERERLAALARRLGVEGSVIFTGFRSDIPDILAALDLVVQPSLEEGLPVSLIEAMALGRPIVASAVSGIPELVQHGRNGLLVPAGDSNALAGSILALLADPERRVRMGRAAQARALAEFSIERMARQYEAVWSGLLGISSRALQAGVAGSAPILARSPLRKTA